MTKVGSGLPKLGALHGNRCETKGGAGSPFELTTLGFVMGLLLGRHGYVS